MFNEAKTHLSRLSEEVRRGGEVVIAKAGKPVARLVVVTEGPKRQPGSARGQIWIAEDFDAPLPQEIQRFFE
ncbi:MAG: type II toxin-antitoxin system prevent-host-death family antitoxin [Actinomycetota bacterium]|nr:type II toxin-antitoxin system prevent-host-death family antitoxin [Actinomycetota bacterium]